MNVSLIRDVTVRCVSRSSVCETWASLVFLLGIYLVWYARTKSLFWSRTQNSSCSSFVRQLLAIRLFLWELMSENVPAAAVSALFHEMPLTVRTEEAKTKEKTDYKAESSSNYSNHSTTGTRWDPAWGDRGRGRKSVKRIEFWGLPD